MRGLHAIHFVVTQPRVSQDPGWEEAGGAWPLGAPNGFVHLYLSGSDLASPFIETLLKEGGRPEPHDFCPPDPGKHTVRILVYYTNFLDLVYHYARNGAFWPSQRVSDCL